MLEWRSTESTRPGLVAHKSPSHLLPFVFTHHVLTHRPPLFVPNQYRRYHDGVNTKAASRCHSKPEVATPGAWPPSHTGATSLAT